MSRKSYVADRVESWIGMSAKWTAFNGYEQTLTGPTSATADAFSDKAMCCWEMPMLAAKQLGYLTNEQLTSIYQGVMEGGLKKCKPLLKPGLMWTSTNAYPGTKPARGDLVFFGDSQQGELAHVTVALGEEVEGQTLIMSFWTAAPRLAAMDWFAKYGNKPPTVEGKEAYKRLEQQYTEVDARVVKTTIEAMAAGMEVICQAVPSISSAEPVWA